MREIDEELTATIVEYRRQEWLKGVREYIARKRAEKACGIEVKIVPLPLPDRRKS